MKDKTILSKVVLVILIVLIAGFSVWFSFSSNGVVQDIERRIRSYGSLGPLMLILIYIATIVFSPLAGSPLVITSLALYGLRETLIYTYISNVIGATINFYIARKFGRPLVNKLVSRKDMREIDEIGNKIGLRTLVLFRLMGGGAFDFVSYAAGLTAMNYGTYILVTALGLIPSSIMFTYLLSKAISVPLIYSIPLFAIVYIIVVVIPAFVYKRQKDSWNEQSDQ